MKRQLFLLLLSCFLPACQKDESRILVLDHVTKTRYYQAEIFNDTDKLIYGKWKFLEYSGGFGGETYPPTYDYLEVVEYGIYGIIKRNSIREIGKLIKIREDNQGTTITFFPDARYMTDTQMIRRVIGFQGHDTLRLWDGYADGYFYLYKRIK